MFTHLHWGWRGGGGGAGHVEWRAWRWGRRYCNTVKSLIAWDFILFLNVRLPKDLPDTSRASQSETMFWKSQMWGCVISWLLGVNRTPLQPEKILVDWIMWFSSCKLQRLSTAPRTKYHAILLHLAPTHLSNHLISWILPQSYWTSCLPQDITLLSCFLSCLVNTGTFFCLQGPPLCFSSNP